jgi:GNAT superfamily N-acetyltransferase
MGSPNVRPVRSRRDLNAFVKLPFRLHRGTPWVPPLITERREFLDRDKNPFFEHAEAEYFLAERDGEVVGRITAQIDDRWTQFQGGNDGMFGFFESEDDPEVARALVAAAAEWARAHGRERMLGPMDFTTNDECGLLVEGHELEPLVLEPWHPPYYQRLLEALGMTKAMDLWMWRLAMGELKQGDQFHDFIHQASRAAREEHGVVVRKMRKRDLEAEVARFMDVYNEAWGHNWGFVPITEAEVRFQAKNLKPILDENWAMVAERDGEVVGAALSLPDVNQVLARMNGRLLPFGWWRFLVGRRRIDRIRVFALGVKPAYQHLGVAAALYVRHLEVAARVRQKWGEMGWILEVNEPMNRAMEGMGGTVTKRYRLYELPLSGSKAG